MNHKKLTLLFQLPTNYLSVFYNAIQLLVCHTSSLNLYGLSFDHHKKYLHLTGPSNISSRYHYMCCSKFSSIERKFSQELHKSKCNRDTMYFSSPFLRDRFLIRIWFLIISSLICLFFAMFCLLYVKFSLVIHLDLDRLRILEKSQLGVKRHSCETQK